RLPSRGAPLFDNSTPNDGGRLAPAPVIYSSEAEWAGSRPLTGPSKVRFLPLEPCARRRARALAARWREHPPRKREAPVRFRTRALRVPLSSSGQDARLSSGR